METQNNLENAENKISSLYYVICQKTSTFMNQNLGVNDPDFRYVKSTYITSIFWKITRKEDTWMNKEYMEKLK
jgi:hypothetical protein